MTLLLLLYRDPGATPGTVEVPCAAATAAGIRPYVSGILVPAAAATARGLAPTLPSSMRQDYVEVALEEQSLAMSSDSRASTVRRIMPVRSFQVAPRALGYSLDAAPGKYITGLPNVVAGMAVDAELEERMYLDDLAMLLAAAGWDYEQVDGVDPDGRAIPNDVGCWSFTRSPNRVLRTAQVRVGYGAQEVSLRLQGMAVEALSLDHDAMLRASMRGLRIVQDSVVTPASASGSSGPSSSPARRGYMRLVWSSQTTVAVDAFALNLSTPVRSRSTATLAGGWANPTLLEHAPERGSTAGSVTWTNVGQDEIDLLESGATFGVEAVWGSASASSSDPTYTHAAWLNAPRAQYVSSQPEALSSRRRRPAQFQWRAGYDATMGAEATITVACSMLALE